MSEDKNTEQDDYLNLPDDELPDYPPEDSQEAPEAPEEDEDEAEGTDALDDNDDTDDEETEEEDTDDDDNDDEGDNDDESGDGGDTDSEDDSGLEESDEEDLDPEGEQSEGSEKPESGSKSTGKGKVKKKKVTEQEVTIGADVQLKQLFAPFKANGRDMQVSSVDDALTLMKMGANYNKKMQGLKPNLRLMKMLGNNDLLDEEKLTYLIDLQNKNPQAIAKLLKDSGIDPIEMEEDNTDYTPGAYTVNEKEVDLEMVLEDIKDTPSFQKTVDTIRTKWDAGSRKLVEEDPEIIRVINDHIDTGMYDQIMGIVQNEKALNRLTEMSDLQAYRFVGDSLQQEGAFAQQPLPNGKKTTNRKPQDPKLKSRKKAAANTRSKPRAKQGAIDPLMLSDEDFAKLDPALM